MIGDCRIIIDYNRLNGEITAIRHLEKEGVEFKETDNNKVPFVEVLGILEYAKFVIFDELNGVDLEDEDLDDEEIEWFEKGEDDDKDEEEDEADEEGGETLGV